MTDLHAHPTSDELLEATIEFLAAGLADVVPPEHRFHLRVAVNALEIVRRELRSGPDDEEAHRRRLATAGFADDGDLAAAIRSGELPDARLGEIRAILLADAQARLRVANPRYVADYDG